MSIPKQTLQDVDYHKYPSGKEAMKHCTEKVGRGRCRGHFCPNPLLSPSRIYFPCNPLQVASFWPLSLVHGPPFNDPCKKTSFSMPRANSHATCPRPPVYFVTLYPQGSSSAKLSFITYYITVASHHSLHPRHASARTAESSAALPDPPHPQSTA